MRLEFVGIQAEPAVPALTAAVDQEGDRWVWSVANRGDVAVAVRQVRTVFRLEGAAPPVPLFRNGYQSWSRTGLAIFGIDEDPSRHPSSLAFVRDMHHADRAVAGRCELRSEQVTVLRGPTDDYLLVGFLGGATHEGTIRLRPSVDNPDVVEVCAEAFLGGAEVAGGESRPLHDLVVIAGDDHAALLEEWAGRVGQAEAARTSAPYQVGWCSWYHYFHDVTEEHIRSNLALAGDWPFEVFQVDDGYQAAIGDWLVTNEKFPSGIEGVAADIDAAGYVPGIWIAPFIAAPDSALAGEHPEYFARARGRDEPQAGMWHDVWGGVMWGLDTTDPAVQEHLAVTSAGLVDAGYRYLKLDFTFSAAVEGRFHNPAMTPAERVRAGYEAVRRGAGEDTFILGCGCPLGAVVGVVDGMRIGPDVAPSWDGDGQEVLPGYDDTRPSTKGAWRSTLARSFMHRKLWLNDPDCVMLRASETDLAPERARDWALAVGASGGMALVSDDLALLDGESRALLDEVIHIGRLSDDGAAAGHPARCVDLLERDPPIQIRLPPK